mmetsp:Transcript_6245/g.7319  ORF Transcript_6245/g.7319 Transcript_6245/m.7319 type:complete len:200 (+) Transcript_6245:31-630(+)|eukprot:CAMPEP_0170469224 /NCGR_PEP_ID=MMETSP0123-20130129/12129_1 /TAXON_ID=182087 /ORGANISM="Favella ehrenbergii, Strain Fehren 1" /LENGTH=199 /DNA_ID=CAMNT_0010736029 /DNA_START=23 /DNA_END=622 /DNA_ORIENTATION=-
MMSKLVSVAAGLAVTAEAALRFKGCPKDYAPMESFDVERYAGTWYEIVRDKWTPFEIAQGCDMAEYTLNEDSTVTVKNSGWRPIQGWTAVEGTAVVADSGDASLVVAFNGDPSSSGKPNYTVLDTDYETYSVVYSCGSLLNLASFDFLWILAREKELDEATMLSIVEKIEDRLPHYGFFKNHKMTYQGRFCHYEKRPTI